MKCTCDLSAGAVAMEKDCCAAAKQHLLLKKRISVKKDQEFREETKAVSQEEGWFWRMFPRSGLVPSCRYLCPRSDFWYRRLFFVYPRSCSGGPALGVQGTSSKTILLETTPYLRTPETCQKSPSGDSAKSGKWQPQKRIPSELFAWELQALCVIQLGIVCRLCSQILTW